LHRPWMKNQLVEIHDAFRLDDHRRQPIERCGEGRDEERSSEQAGYATSNSACRCTTAPVAHTHPVAIVMTMGPGRGGRPHPGRPWHLPRSARRGRCPPSELPSPSNASLNLSRDLTSIWHGRDVSIHPSFRAPPTTRVGVHDPPTPSTSASQSGLPPLCSSYQCRKRVPSGARRR